MIMIILLPRVCTYVRLKRHVCTSRSINVYRHLYVSNIVMYVSAGARVHDVCVCMHVRSHVCSLVDNNFWSMGALLMLESGSTKTQYSHGITQRSHLTGMKR